MSTATYEEIDAKAEWEGGYYEVLDWYQDTQVPADLQSLWRQAKNMKDELESVLQQIYDVIDSHGITI